MKCQLNCEVNSPNSQEHIYTCKKILEAIDNPEEHKGIEHDHIYGNLQHQKLASV